MHIHILPYSRVELYKATWVYKFGNSELTACVSFIHSPAVIAGLGLPPSALLSAFHSFHSSTLKSRSSSVLFRNPTEQNQLDRGQASFFSLLFFITSFQQLVFSFVVCVCTGMCAPSEVKRAEKGFPQSAIRNGRTQACTDKKYAEQLCWIKCFLKGGQHATHFARSLAHKVIWLSRLPVSTSCFPSMAEWWLCCLTALTGVK